MPAPAPAPMPAPVVRAPAPPPPPPPSPDPAPAAAPTRRWPLVGLAVLVALLAVAGVVVGVRLWDTSVPSGLQLPDLDVTRQFSARALERAESFEAFVRVTSLLSTLTLIVVLVVYAKRGHVFMRESAAGPIGTGFLLGMLGLALVWLAQLPFGLVDLWWARRHHVVEIGYVEWLLDGFFGLGGEFLYLCLALLIVMALARVLRRSWWIPASVAFAVLFAAFAFTSPYLVPGLRAPEGEQLRAQARQVARAEGVGSVPLRIEEVHDWTDQPNAYAFGLGASRRVVLWDTIVDFPRPEVRVVMAHEYGHVARHHIAKSIGWFVLLIVPTLFLAALVTRRRGGLADPRAVPLALLVVVVVQLLTSPLQAAATRRYEAEADWRALQTTHDPAAMRALFKHFTARSLADPDPPGWYHALFDDHPSGLERIEMARAWALTHRERALRTP